MKKIIFMVFVWALLPAMSMAQLKLDTLGTVIVGEGNYMAVPSLGKSSMFIVDTVGIAINSKYSFTAPYRLYTYNQSLYLSRTNTNYSGFPQKLPGGLRVKSNRIQIYPANMMESDLDVANMRSSGAPLTVVSSSSSSPALFVKGEGFAQSNIDYAYLNRGAITVEVPNNLSRVSISAREVNSLGTYSTTFFVRSDGLVYGKNGFVQSSDISKKENIDSIPSRSALDALTALRGVSFSYKEGAQSLSRSESSRMNAQTMLEKSVDDSGAGDNQPEEVAEEDRIPEEVLAQMEAERGRKRIGLIAQEVEAVVPEVVRTLPDGSKGIMYTDLVGLIVEGMKAIQSTVRNQDSLLRVHGTLLKEQDVRIDSLEQIVKFYSALIPAMDVVAIVDTVSAPFVPGRKIESIQAEGIASSLANQVTLYQNIPNPFSTSTEIVYVIPEGLGDCAIGVYDLNGRILKQYTLNSLSGKIIVQGNELEPGTYIYTLIAGGEVLASRKMIRSH